MNDLSKSSPGALVAVGPVATETGLRVVEQLIAAFGLTTAFIRVLPAFPEPVERSGHEAAEQADFEMLEKATFSDDVNRKLETTVWQETEVLRSANTFAGTLAWAAGEWKAALVVLTGADPAQIEAIRDVAYASRLPVFLVRQSISTPRRVLIATALSDHEVPVVRYGVDLARRMGASAVIIHNSPGDADSRMDAHRSLKTEAAALATEAGVDVEVAITRAPSVVSAVVEYVALHNPQMLVLGSYPRTNLTAWLAPSISQAIISGTSCNAVVLSLREE